VDSPYPLGDARPRSRRLDEGEPLFHAGDPVRDMYLVAEGELSLMRVLADGRPVPIGRSGPGETVAEASLFAERYHCDCVARGPTRVLAYAKADVLRALADSPERMVALVRHLAGQVHGLRARVEVLSLAGAAPRILAYVSARADARGVWAMDRTWKAVAGELGLSHEALYRALARLERADRLERTGRQVRLTG